MMSGFSELSKNIVESGYHVERHFWSDEECNELIAISHQWENYKAGNLISVLNPHRSHPRFYQAFAHPKLKDGLSALFDGPVSGLQSQLFYGPPGCSGYTPHQDFFFNQVNPLYFMTVWSALEDTDAENGGLIVYPGSHLAGSLPVREVPPERRGPGQDPSSDRHEVIFEKKYPEVSLSIPKGAAVFLHANLIHASHANRTEDRFRHVLLCTYLKSGQPYRAGQYAKRVAVPL